MNVQLLYHTPEPERAIAAAARLCYAPVGAAELMEVMSDEQIHSILRTILRSGHLAALEHASYTFAIDGVSRAMTHQLVRHRLASYNQQSQRYVDYDTSPDFILPPSVADNPQAARVYMDSCARDFDAYRSLIDLGVPKEDARYLLPNAMETKIVV
ncbi:MAG: FAD-dependent thymidylate synthase, partial [Actinomycetes bacterium]|nr:FAD-dependent thymidylate synthase [Actinomycetes bacterium]